jgi:cholesterol oxidase
MVTVTGAGVGGGCLLYANVSIDAAPDCFAKGWPSAISFDRMDPYYERVAGMLKPRPIPDDQHPPRLESMRSAADAIGAGERFRKLDLAVTFDDDTRPDGGVRRNARPHPNGHGRVQGTCTHIGHCAIGSKSRAKNTLDLNYLTVAEDAGAHIHPLCQVSHLSLRDGLWQVHFRDALDDSHELRTVCARRVILAAGSIGTTEILLRSRSEFRTLEVPPEKWTRGYAAC